MMLLFDTVIFQVLSVSITSLAIILIVLFAVAEA
jgi:hypothetical protein